MIEYKKDAEWQVKMLQYLRQNKAEVKETKKLNLSGFGLNWGIWHYELGSEFSDYYDIESIDLSKNYIDTQIIDFCSFRSLKTINLSNNPLFYWGNEGRFRLDEQINAPGLEILDLSNCQTGIVIIGQKAAFLNSLKYLDLSGNHFTDYHIHYPNYPPQLKLAILSNLTSLALRENYYSFVPKLRFLPTLETLDLSNNPLRSNFQELTFLPKLTILKLNYTGLKKIPECLFKLNNLKEIHLEGNEIQNAEMQKLRTQLNKVSVIN